MSKRQAILDLVNKVVESLADDIEQFVFVGGVAAALLTNDPEVADVRPTDDVDLIADITTYAQYNSLIEVLRTKHGFAHDINGPLCRFKVQGVTVDVMPTNEKVLNFSNKWYQEAMANPLRYVLPSQKTIKLVSAPVFLCTKMEAFLDRGKNDYFGSADLEDIITLIMGRQSLLSECRGASTEIKQYLSERFSSLLHTQNFLDSLEVCCHWALGTF